MVNSNLSTPPKNAKKLVNIVDTKMFILSEIQKKINPKMLKCTDIALW